LFFWISHFFLPNLLYLRTDCSKNIQMVTNYRLNLNIWIRKNVTWLQNFDENKDLKIINQFSENTFVTSELSVAKKLSMNEAWIISQRDPTNSQQCRIGRCSNEFFSLRKGPLCLLIKDRKVAFLSLISFVFVLIWFQVANSNF
jgi:hypothetical protein